MKRSSKKLFSYKTFCQADGWYAVMERKDGEATVQKVVGWATLDGESAHDDEIVGILRDPDGTCLYPVGSFNDYFAGFVHLSEFKEIKARFPDLKIKSLPTWIEAAP